MSKIIITILTIVVLFFISNLIRRTLISMRDDAHNSSNPEKKSSELPPDVLNLKYFQKILAQGKEQLHSTADIHPTLDNLVDQSTHHSFGREEWDILRKMHVRILKDYDLNHAQHVFDDAIEQADQLIRLRYQKGPARNAPNVDMATAFVIIVNLISIFINFTNPVLAKINFAITVTTVLGILITILGDVLFNNRSRLATFGINFATISATIMLANSIVALIH